MLIKSKSDGEPAQLCDAGISKITGLVPLRFQQKLLGLLNQRSPERCSF